MLHSAIPQALDDSQHPLSYDERDLWCSVVKRAVDDLRERPDETDKYSVHSRSVRKLKALAWFRSDRDELGSFVWICDLLGIDPARIRTKLLS